MEMLSDLVRFYSVAIIFLRILETVAGLMGTFPTFQPNYLVLSFLPGSLSPFSQLQHKAQYNTDHTKGLGTLGLHVRRLEHCCYP